MLLSALSPRSQASTVSGTLRSDVPSVLNVLNPPGKVPHSVDPAQEPLLSDGKFKNVMVPLLVLRLKVRNSQGVSSVSFTHHLCFLITTGKRLERKELRIYMSNFDVFVQYLATANV